MLTFTKLGVWGNLGNSLFQIASCIGLSEKYKCELFLPEWKNNKYFNLSVPQKHVSAIAPDITIHEPHFHYAGDFFDNYADDFKTKTINISGNGDTTGWLQSEKYWLHCKNTVMEHLSFSKEFAGSIRERHKDILSGETICISIRRGDYVDNPNYELLPITYYLLALTEHFGYHKHQILIFSDDIPYCKVHFGCLENVFFAEGLNAIEQLCLGSMCKHFIIANSTFSWWMAYLSQTTGKVIRPNYLFNGKLKKLHNDKDFWPEQWHVFDHKLQHEASH